MPTKPVQQVQAKREKLLKEIEKLQQALNGLNAEEAYASQLTELCPSCQGRCEESYTDAAGSRDWRECPTCKGWGYISNGLKCPQCGKSLDGMIYLRRQPSPSCPFCGKYLSLLFERGER